MYNNKNYAIMKTEMYFNLELNVNLTRFELSNIYDALFISIREYRKLGYHGIADNYEKIFNKLGEQITKIDNMCK